MLEQELVNKTYSYAFYLMAVSVFAGSVSFHNAALLALSAVLLLAAGVYFRSGHVVNNFLLKKGKLIEVYNGYRLGENLASAVKGVNNYYSGVACAVMKGSVREQNGEALAKLVQNACFPFEFSLGLKNVDQARILDRLEEKRRFKEIELSRSDPKKHDRLNLLRRELSIVENEIRAIRGEKMLSLAIKLRTFSRANDEYEAAREAHRNMEQLANAFSSLGLECEIMKGEQLLSELSIEGGSA